MKTKLTALALLAATAVSLVPTPARADDRGLAVVGGFLGGLLVASAINDSHHGNYAPAYVAPCAPSYDYRGNDGCWENVSVQVLVPGCWVVERGYYGEVVRRYIAPHYEYRTNRVWVVANRDHYRNDRHDGHRRDGRYDDDRRNDRRDRRDHDSRGRSHR